MIEEEHDGPTRVKTQEDGGETAASPQHPHKGGPISNLQLNGCRKTT